MLYINELFVEILLLIGITTQFIKQHITFYAKKLIFPFFVPHISSLSLFLHKLTSGTKHSKNVYIKLRNFWHQQIFTQKSVSTSNNS